MPKLNAIRIMALVSIAFSAWFYYLTLDFPEGAAILPRALLILFAGCATGLLVQSCLGKGDLAHENLGLKNPGRLFAGAGVFVLYVVGIFVAGYYLASAVFVVVLASLLGYRSVVTIAAVAILYPTAVYVVFEMFLMVPMP